MLAHTDGAYIIDITSMSQAQSSAMQHDVEEVFPPETWGLILGHLPQDVKRRLLLTSPSFHVLVLPLVFSHITVSFGLWQLGAMGWDVEEHEEVPDTFPTSPQYHAYMATVEKTELRTCELLAHIACTPDFARVIRKITVRAYGPHRHMGNYELCK